jgi:hypothetical protein
MPLQLLSPSHGPAGPPLVVRAAPESSSATEAHHSATLGPAPPVPLWDQHHRCRAEHP